MFILEDFFEGHGIGFQIYIGLQLVTYVMCIDKFIKNGFSGPGEVVLALTPIVNFLYVLDYWIAGFSWVWFKVSALFY